LGEGLAPKARAASFRAKTRLMKAGSIWRPQKAQVKDKGLRAESGDLELESSYMKSGFWRKVGPDGLEPSTQKNYRFI